MTFSILIPCYNVSKYIEKCLESVICQTYTDWEVILIDDGSTDGTIDIIKFYAEKEKRIKAFYQKENQGVSAIRNLLIKESTGNFIIFLDSDDWWRDQKSLEQIATSLENSNADIIAFQYNIVRQTGSTAQRDNNTQLLKESVIYTGEEYLKTVLGQKAVYQWYPFLYAFKKQLWVENNIKFNPKTYALEDAEVLYRVIICASKLTVIHVPIYQYRIEREGKLTQTSEQFLNSMIDFSVKNIKKVMEMDIEQELKVLLCDNFSCQYYSALYSVNYLRKEYGDKIFASLDKYRFIMSYTRKKKYVILSKIVRIFGLHATSKIWFLFANVRRKWKSF